VISSDFCHGLVADGENDKAATPQAFEPVAVGRDEAAPVTVGQRLARWLETRTRPRYATMRTPACT